MNHMGAIAFSNNSWIGPGNCYGCSAAKRALCNCEVLSVPCDAMIE